MSETISTKALPEVLFRLIHTEKVRLNEQDGIIQLTPINENTDCTVGLRGLFANCPEMSVDKFMERKRADKELEL
ncbi:MAG: hypothetical protein FWG70_11395 [Oscillospiraceae bacterium]|nr:hypothetical protein [Oscillospiraceae bacterium]